MKRPKTPKPPGRVNEERLSALESEKERRRLLMARGRSSTIASSPMGDVSRPLMAVARAYAAQG